MVPLHPRIVEFSAIVIIMVLTAGLMGYSAHLGGKMVYGLGAAGVIPMKEIIIQGEGGQRHHHDGEEINGHEHSGHHHDKLNILDL